MPLYRDVQPGDELRIGDTVISIEAKTGQRTRLRIDSVHEVQHRKAGARLSQAPVPTQLQPTAPPEPEARPVAPPSQPAPARRARLQLPQPVATTA